MQVTGTNAVRNAAISAIHTREIIELFSKISDAWGLNSDQQVILLGSPARSTFFKWKKEGGLLPADTQERISHILSIYKSLEILIPDGALADKWVRSPNDAFNGESALDHALAGRLAGLYEVRRYLDAQRGG